MSYSKCYLYRMPWSANVDHGSCTLIVWCCNNATGKVSAVATCSKTDTGTEVSTG